jgi:hypothetical protein
VFYDSLTYYYQKSPDKLRAVFEQHGVGGGNLAAVMNAGQKYQASLTSIDTEEESIAFAKYGAKPTAGNGRLPTIVNGGKFSDTVKAGDPVVPVQQKLRNLNPGQSLASELAKDGSVGRYHGKMTAALAAHKQDLRKSVGNASLKNLSDWVDTEVAPTVKEVVQAPVVNSPERPTAIQAAAAAQATR